MDRNFAFVLNQCSTNARSPRAGEASSGLQMLGVFAEPLLRLRAEFQDAIAAGLGVTEYAPHGKAADEIRTLWKWVERRRCRGALPRICPRTTSADTATAATSGPMPATGDRPGGHERRPAAGLHYKPF
jgi:hypothetical protein